MAIKKVGSLMITLVEKPYLKIKCDVEPCLVAQQPLKMYDDELRKLIEKKPFLNKRHILFQIDYEGEQYCLVFNKGYRWDGATIPPGVRWLIGSPSNPKFLLASMVHDKICENHYLIDNDRELSSIILRELLLASDVNVVSAYIMYNAVNPFQKFFCGWKEQSTRGQKPVYTAMEEGVLNES